MTDTVNILFSLLQFEIFGSKVPEKAKKGITDDSLSELFNIAKRHDVAHLIGDALIKNDLLKEDKIKEAFEQQIYMAVYRYQNLNFQLEKICKLFEENKIPFIPLKGAVIRKYYPEPWMRTSCDIDILVKNEDLDKSIALLENTLKYRRGDMSAHDVSLFLNDTCHVELHYELIEDLKSQKANRVLKRVWDYSKPLSDESSHYQMNDEMFYFYHIAHMAKHFEIGGCGIRTFIDLKILQNNNFAGKTELLNEGGLLKFSEVATDLCDKWFYNKESNFIVTEMEDFILNGGIYGSMQNLVAAQQLKRGGKFNYALSKIFLPYDIIKYHYTILIKKKWLTPFFEVVRWFKLLFKGGVKRSLRELHINGSVTEKEHKSLEELFKNLEL